MHWDIDIRLLAAKALGKISFVCPDYVCSTLLHMLPDGVVSPSLAIRHGCIVVAAECILALSIQGHVPAELSEEVSLIVMKVDKARLYRYNATYLCSMMSLLIYLFFRGRGSEILREASCKLIECIARAQLPLVSKSQVWC